MRSVTSEPGGDEATPERIRDWVAADLLAVSAVNPSELAAVAAAQAAWFDQTFPK